MNIKQCEHSLRMDGFYVFDNEIDTVVYLNSELTEQLKFMVYDVIGMPRDIHERQTYISRDPSKLPAINSAESRRIEIISFFSDSLGYVTSSFLEKDIVGLVRKSEDKKDGNFEGWPQELFYDDFYGLWIGDSCQISFSIGSIDTFRKDYYGMIYQDSLVLTINRIADTFNPPQERTYHFYTKEELLERYRD